jgi:hypothetical protein
VAAKTRNRLTPFMLACTTSATPQERTVSD